MRFADSIQQHLAAESLGFDMQQLQGTNCCIPVCRYSFELSSGAADTKVFHSIPSTCTSAAAAS